MEANQNELLTNWKNEIMFIADDEDYNIHMKQADQFQREIDYRAMLSTFLGGTVSSESSVVGLILHDNNWQSTGSEFVNRFRDYPNLLVMPAAERSLRDIIDKEDMTKQVSDFTL